MRCFSLSGRQEGFTAWHQSLTVPELKARRISNAKSARNLLSRTDGHREGACGASCAGKEVIRGTVNDGVVRLSWTSVRTQYSPGELGQPVLSTSFVTCARPSADRAAGEYLRPS
jgi:hypothetical protein